MRVQCFHFQRFRQQQTAGVEGGGGRGERERHAVAGRDGRPEAEQLLERAEPAAHRRGGPLCRRRRAPRARRRPRRRLEARHLQPPARPLCATLFY